MRFGIYAGMQCPDDKPFAALYDDVVRQMAHADEQFRKYKHASHPFTTTSPGRRRRGARQRARPRC